MTNYKRAIVAIDHQIQRNAYSASLRMVGFGEVFEAQVLRTALKVLDILFEAEKTVELLILDMDASFCPLSFMELAITHRSSAEAKIILVGDGPDADFIARTVGPDVCRRLNNLNDLRELNDAVTALFI